MCGYFLNFQSLNTKIRNQSSRLEEIIKNAMKIIGSVVSTVYTNETKEKYIERIPKFIEIYIHIQGSAAINENSRTFCHGSDRLIVWDVFILHTVFQITFYESIIVNNLIPSCISTFKHYCN